MIRKIFDFVVIPVFILTLAYDPNFIHGPINFFECGQYLSYVNGFFHGKIPARDFIVLFGPFQVYIIAFAMLLFGKTLAVLRTYFYVVYLLGFFAAYLLARQVCRTRLFIFFAVVLCLLETAHPFWATRWDFGRAATGLLVLSFLAIFLRTDNIKALFTAALLNGFSLFYSIDIGIVSGLSALSLIMAVPLKYMDGKISYDPRKLVRMVIVYGIGIACVVLPVLVFTFYKGGFIDYLKTTFIILPAATFKIWGQAVPSLKECFSQGQSFVYLMQNSVFKEYLPAILYICAAIYLLRSFIKKNWDKDRPMVFMLFVYGVTMYRMSFRSINGPQFQVALVPLIVLAAFFLERLAMETVSILSAIKGDMTRRNWSPIKLALLITILALSFTYVIVSPKRYFGNLSGWCLYQAHKKDFLGHYMNPITLYESEYVIARTNRVGKIKIPIWQDDAIDNITVYLKENTGKDEEVFSYPDKGAFNFFANRPSFSRFYTSGTAWSCPEWQKELLDELEAKKPKVVLTGVILSNMATGIGRTEEVMPEVGHYLEKKYYPDCQYGDIVISVRKD